MQIPESCKNIFNKLKDPTLQKRVACGVTALFFATLLLAGVGGSFALIGGHAAWAPHFMSVMNTFICQTWNGMPYAMVAGGLLGAVGLAQFAVEAVRAAKVVIVNDEQEV